MDGRSLAVEREPRWVPDPLGKTDVELLPFRLLFAAKPVVGSELKSGAVNQRPEAWVVRVGRRVEAAREQVLALGHIGLALVLVGGIAEALVQAALQEEQAAEPVAVVVKVGLVGKLVGEP